MNKKIFLVALPTALVLTILTILILLLVGVLELPSGTSQAYAAGTEETGSPADTDKDADTDADVDKSQTETVSPTPETDKTGDSDKFDYDSELDELTDDPLLPYNSSSDSENWNLMLVNNDNKVPLTFRVTLSKVSGNYLVDSRILDPLKEMISAAKDDGINIQVCSAFRTVKFQQSLLDAKVNHYKKQGKSADKAYELARFYLAYPGFSEHHTGLAVDFIADGYTSLNENFAKSSAYAWLSENAHLYGFILRYQEDKEGITGFKFEPWHYRYVGIEHATVIRKEGLCLEEYLEKYSVLK